MPVLSFNDGPGWKGTGFLPESPYDSNPDENKK